MNLEANIFFLAAGLGSRLKPLTLKYPKPCVPFLNVPMGLYQFQYLKYLSYSRLVVNTFHLPEKIKYLYTHQPYFKGEVLFSNETEKILGSSGGLKKASALMDLTKSIVLMNADEVFFTTEKNFLSSALEQHQKNKALATLIVMKHPEAGKKFGAIWSDVKNINGQPIEVVKDISKTVHHQNLKPWHFIGTIILSPEILKLIPDNLETNIFYDTLLQELPKERVQIYSIEPHWYETGNPIDFFTATQEVLNQLTPDTLDFINQYDPSILIKNTKTFSLISKTQKINFNNLSGVNVISKSAKLSVSEKLHDTVAFEKELLNKSYFS